MILESRMKLAIVLVTLAFAMASAINIVNHAAVMRAARDPAYIVVDVREASAFRKSQVPNSINLPCPSCNDFYIQYFGQRTPVIIGGKADQEKIDGFVSTLEYAKILPAIDQDPFETYPFPTVSSTTPYYTNVTCKDVYGLDPYPYIIDVREVDEYANGHAPRAYNIPLGHLRDRANEIDVTKPVHVICHSGYRSTLATLQLVNELGFTNIVNINDGTVNWPRPHESSPMPNYLNVTKEDVKGVYKTVTIIDVRAKVDYDKRHIPGALNIPYADLLVRAGEVPDGAYVICYSGRSSLAATKMLVSDAKKKGLKNVMKGMNAWDGPVEPTRY